LSNPITPTSQAAVANALLPAISLLNQFTIQEPDGWSGNVTLDFYQDFQNLVETNFYKVPFMGVFPFPLDNAFTPVNYAIAAANGVLFKSGSAYNGGSIKDRTQLGSVGAITQPASNGGYGILGASQSSADEILDRVLVCAKSVIQCRGPAWKEGSPFLNNFNHTTIFLHNFDAAANSIAPVAPNPVTINGAATPNPVPSGSQLTFLPTDIAASSPTANPIGELGFQSNLS
jgi:hypothetical protein